MDPATAGTPGEPRLVPYVFPSLPTMQDDASSTFGACSAPLTPLSPPVGDILYGASYFDVVMLSGNSLTPELPPIHPLSPAICSEPQLSPYAPTFYASSLPEVSPADMPNMYETQSMDLYDPMPYPDNKSQDTPKPQRSRGRRVSSCPDIAGGKIFVCKMEDCGKVFKRSEHLKRHIRSIHTREKPFRCPYPTCAKQFSRSDNLNQHIRIHRHSLKEGRATSNPFGFVGFVQGYPGQ
ncbi:hypothetical protein BZG36_04260 [Bifiguratus adelaidae]|uniref:C2H2-type domain-containing protein n=1 Tax=Bifiguratus adelaidae TaxID=1938954 RepID=A0A261XW07_9FUNG|nr:hypothetical protein BZG36_04260 [Bifiguratus adelaidae]